MKRDITSKRTKKWIQQNDLSSDYVKKKVTTYCESQAIGRYEVGIYKNNTALYVFIDKNEYFIIYLEQSVPELKLLHINCKKLDFVRHFNRNDCWYQAINQIINHINIQQVNIQIEKIA